MGPRMAACCLALIGTTRAHPDVPVDAPWLMPEASAAAVRALAAHAYNPSDERYIHVEAALAQLLHDLKARDALDDAVAVLPADARLKVHNVRSLAGVEGCPACVCTPEPPPPPAVPVPPAMPASWPSPPADPPLAPPADPSAAEADQTRTMLFLWAGVIGSLLLPATVVIFVTYCCGK